MRRLPHLLDDFEAMIRILTLDEGGRRSPAFNGIRWSFAYVEEPPAKEAFEIHPDFFDEHGDSLATDKPLSTDMELPARMYILRDEMRHQVHRARLREGVRFHCREGGKRVAEGRVTRITGLFTERAKP